MAKKIEDLYQSHMQKSSPDMDMLWARIDKRIDAEQDKQKDRANNVKSPLDKGQGKIIQGGCAQIDDDRVSYGFDSRVLGKIRPVKGDH